MTNLTVETSIYSNFVFLVPLNKALNALQKDLKTIFGQNFIKTSVPGKNQIQIIIESGYSEEEFMVKTVENTGTIIISGSDELGIIFGIYYFTEHILGVDPLYYWTDYELQKATSIKVESLTYRSKNSSPRFRGWFINDEDCLTAWDDSITITEDLWDIIFESILRCGYNTVIPGTGTTPDDKQLDLADSYGLWIAQHHAEPLGASMLNDIFPDVKAKLPEEKDKFEILYREAVNKSKHRKTLWTVGFRGQGDRPFYKDDTRYDSPFKRGQLIEEMINFQQEIVNELTDSPQVFLHYLYSESGDLYRSGNLSLPENIIRVYSDNGFGAMRIRRNLSEKEPGISSLPVLEDKNRGLGVYYHVSFHDLEISNKLVPLIDPNIVIDSLKPFTEASKFEFFICNVSNIRPHVFHIDILRSLWNRNEAVNLEEGIFDSTDRWLKKHFCGFEKEVGDILKEYYEAPFCYNDKYPDSKAGEQVYHHGLRRMIRGIIRDEDTRNWFTYIPESFNSEAECYHWLLDRAQLSMEKWNTLIQKANTLEQKLYGRSKQFFNDNIGMHIRYMGFSCNGFILGIKAVLSYKSEEYQRAFTIFSQSRNYMEKALEVLLKGEHGKWKNFYRGDWLTGTRENIRHIDTILSLSRIKGEDIIVNSEWMIEALNLTKTTISIIPQSNTSYLNLGNSLHHKELNEKGKSNRSLLGNTDI